jgi:hypothetical protein
MSLSCLKAFLVSRGFAHTRGIGPFYYLELLRASEGTLSSWPWLHLQSVAPTNPHWVHVVGHGLFSLCVIHKESLYPSSGDIYRLMMMMTYIYLYRSPPRSKLGLNKVLAERFHQLAELFLVKAN